MSSFFALLIWAASLGAASNAQLAALVQKLGHNSHAVRSAAARDLVAAGTRAMPALKTGTKHTDAEVAERCRQLLPIAAEAGRKKLLAKLVEVPAGPPPAGLAGVDRFLKIAGDDRAARQLYAEMMEADPELVEASASSPKEAARLFGAFAKRAFDRARGAELAGRNPYADFLTSRGEVALFLFVRSDPRFEDAPVADEVGTHGWEAIRLVRAAQFKSAVAGPEAGPGLKKLFLHWLTVERLGDETGEGYDLAKATKMVEAVPLALKAVHDRKNNACFRAYLIQDFLAAMGSKNQVNDLAPLLTDDSGLGSLQVGDGPVLAPQVRDVALAVSIRLAGQKPADFGFHSGGFADEKYRTYYGGYGFIDDNARAAALAKWRTWVNEKGHK